MNSLVITVDFLVVVVLKSEIITSYCLMFRFDTIFTVETCRDRSHLDVAIFKVGNEIMLVNNHQHGTNKEP